MVEGNTIWWCATVILFPTPQLMTPYWLKSAMMRAITPWKLANAKNQLPHQQPHQGSTVNYVSVAISRRSLIMTGPPAIADLTTDQRSPCLVTQALTCLGKPCFLRLLLTGFASSEKHLLMIWEAQELSTLPPGPFVCSSYKALPSYSAARTCSQECGRWRGRGHSLQCWKRAVPECVGTYWGSLPLSTSTALLLFHNFSFNKLKKKDACPY